MYVCETCERELQYLYRYVAYMYFIQPYRTAYCNC